MVLLIGVKMMENVSVTLRVTGNGVLNLLRLSVNVLIILVKKENGLLIMVIVIVNVHQNIFHSVMNYIKYHTLIVLL
jgi:hypothetical protein